MVAGKKVSYNEAVAHLIERFHRAYLANIFVCDICSKTIEPVVKVWGDEVFIESKKHETREGKGNKVIKKNVCEDCLKEINLGINID